MIFIHSFPEQSTGQSYKQFVKAIDWLTDNVGEVEQVRYVRAAKTGDFASIWQELSGQYINLRLKVECIMEILKSVENAHGPGWKCYMGEYLTFGKSEMVIDIEDDILAVQFKLACL
jgi:hypothetical protein